MHKLWFYIALSAIIIGGVWLSTPGEADRQRIRKAVAQKKAARAQQKTTSDAASYVASAASVAPASAAGR